MNLSRVLLFAAVSFLCAFFFYTLLQLIFAWLQVPVRAGDLLATILSVIAGCVGFLTWVVVSSGDDDSSGGAS